MAISGKDNLRLFDENIGSLIVAPIFVDGSFYGHFSFGWQKLNKEIQDYELEFAELMAQTLKNRN